MALQSKLFGGDTKLEAAAVSDPAHILQGASGPHVGKIQLALIQVDGASISQDSVYGSGTAAAVRAFKQKRQILNAQGKIDDIVGKKTIAALDAEMLAKEGRGGGGGRLGFKIVDDTPFGPPAPLKGTAIADMIVRFDGAAAAGSMPTDDVFDPQLVPGYTRMAVPSGVSRIGLFGRVLQRTSDGRLLFRVGRSTATIGTASLPVFIDVLGDLAALQLGLRALPGRIYIFGSSSGGRNAIDFAAHITRLGKKPHFVAAVDAAFFNQDSVIKPNANDDKNSPTSVPFFTVDAGSTPRANCFNFFQTIGNHVKDSLNPFNSSRFFTSSMGGEEIHGEVGGFNNRNLNSSVTKRGNDDKAHEDCGTAGNQQAKQLIAADIRRFA